MTRKILISLLTTVLLLGTVAASQAFTWHVQTVAGFGWATITGVDSDGGASAVPPGAPVYLSRLDASTGDNIINAPSTVVLGTTVSIEKTAIRPNHDTWTDVPTSFKVDISHDFATDTHTMLIEGLIRKSDTEAVGEMSVDAGGVGSSTAAFVVSKITDLTNGNVSLPGVVLDPTGTTSNLILTKVDGIDISFFVEHLEALSPPGDFPNFLAIGGYVTDVPEPGSLALLIGFGVSGSLFLRRRRA